MQTIGIWQKATDGVYIYNNYAECLPIEKHILHIYLGLNHKDVTGKNTELIINFSNI